MVSTPPIVIGLMLSSNNCEGGRSYSKMVQACKDTWIKASRINVKIYMVYGDSHKSHLLNEVGREEYIVTEENEIIVNTRESRENLLKKTVKSMEFCLEKHPNFDFMFRPNCGSYVNTSLLSNFLADKPKEGFYCGINGLHGAIKYSSGSCILMSRDVVQLIVKNQDCLQYDGRVLMDDIAIGDFLCKSGIPLRSDAMREDASTIDALVSKFSKQCYHYYFMHSLNPDLIYKCHELFYGSE